MKKFKIVVIEIGMLLGIVAAAFMVPRNTPLLTFGVISGAVLVLGNVLLVVKMRQVRNAAVQGLSAERNRRLNLIIILFTVYWLLCFFLRRR
jgi:hypothetical protein